MPSSTYFTLLTTAGQAKLANAIAIGVPLRITSMAVGDGNGNPVSPTEGRTALVRSVYSGSLNTLNTDPSNPNYLIAELVVPMSSGGYTVREVGLFDVDGTLIAYGNFPDTYKPLIAEGSGRELVVRMIFQVSSTAAVTLVIDPTIVLATRAWVVAQFTLAKLAPGGLTGQVLMKSSNSDGDATWQSPGASIVNVNAHSEIQTCAGGQTVFNLSTLTTVGLAAYIEGARIFDLTILSSTQVQTPTSYTAGSRIMFVQNDPNTTIQLFGNKTYKVIPTGTTLSSGGVFFVPDNGVNPANYILPASPQDGDVIAWVASDTGFATNSMTFQRNGKTIMGVADDLIVTEDGFCGMLVWRSALNTWRVYKNGVAGA